MSGFFILFQEAISQLDGKLSLEELVAEKFHMNATEFDASKRQASTSGFVPSTSGFGPSTSGFASGQNRKSESNKSTYYSNEFLPTKVI